MALVLAGVEHHHHEVRGLGHGDHLPPSPLALAGSLYDPGQVQQLYARVLVVNHAGDARERGELVRRRLRLREGGREGAREGASE